MSEPVKRCLWCNSVISGENALYCDRKCYSARRRGMPTVEQEWRLIVADAEVPVELSELPNAVDSDRAHARRKLAYLAAFRENRFRRGFTEEDLPWPRWAGDYDSSLRYARTLKWEQDQGRAEREHGAEMETRRKLDEASPEAR